MTVLSWVFVKHATLPLSDVPYFGLSMICLATLRWSIDQSLARRLIGLAVGMFLLIAAIAVRTVGIALIPAFAVSCLPAVDWAKLPFWFKRYPSRSVVLVAALLAATAAGCVAVTQSRYFSEMLTAWSDWRELSRIRLEDWGELMINTSMAKLPRSLQVVVPWTGAFGAFLVCFGAVRRARFGVVDAYALCYIAILLVWPFRDCRFWLPVFPILAAYSWLALDKVASVAWVRRTREIYITVFSLMGCAGLYYSSHISLSGERFPDLYGGGIYRDSYRALASKQSGSNDATNRGDPQLIRLIERYGSGVRLARQRHANSSAVE